MWSHGGKGPRVEVAIEPFEPVTRAQRAGAEAEAERLAVFLGGELELGWA